MDTQTQTMKRIGKAVKLVIRSVYAISKQEQTDIKTLRELTGMLKELTALVLALEKTREVPEQPELRVVFQAGEEQWNE